MNLFEGYYYYYYYYYYRRRRKLHECNFLFYYWNICL